MRTTTKFRAWVGVIALLAASAVAGFSAQVAREAKFEVFQIGTRSFTNATVTTNAAYIFIMHEGGLENVKLSQLTPEAREKLGYVIPTPKSDVVAKWTKSQVSKINVAEIGKTRDRVQAQIANLGHWPPRVRVSSTELAALLTAMLLMYALFAYCCYQICKKTGQEPGPAVWFPVLQVFPLVRAAGMAPVWGVAFLLPFINILAQVVWSFRIARARNKGVLLGLMLILPFTNLFAFLYLALSAASAPEKKERGPQIMTLETA